MLHSVDLFSGIGGFSLALHGICTPLLYCDNSPRVKSVLETLMSKRAYIPIAPVVTDIRDLRAIKAAVGSTHVHVVTAGFPCVGFSTIGSRKGLQNDQSGLFFDMMKVVRALKPDMIVLENVADVLSANEGKDFRVILSELADARYDVRCTVCSAQEVGCPQIRRRWFGLCVRKGVKPPAINISFRTELFTPWAKNAPGLVVDRSPSDSRRYAMLGNALVPLLARLAFARLYSGFIVHDISQLRGIITYGPAKGSIVRMSKQVKHGSTTSTSGAVLKHHVTAVTRHDTATINAVLDPNWFKSSRTYQKNPSRQPLPSLTATKSIDKWPTPRTMSPTHSGLLTARTVRDLPTTVMFTKQLNGRAQSKRRDGQGINPEFVEWLMGFPLGHTAA